MVLDTFHYVKTRDVNMATSTSLPVILAVILLVLVILLP